MNEVLNSFITAINEIGGGFCSFAGSMFIQSSVLILLLLIIDFLVKKRVRATFRYWIWILVFIKLISPPTLSLPTGVGNWTGDYFTAGSPAAEKLLDIEQDKPVIISSIPQTSEPAETPLAQINPTFHEPVSSVKSDITVISAGANLNTLTWQGIIFMLWLIGVLVISVLLIQRIFFVRGLIAQGEPAGSRLIDIVNQCREQVGVRRNIKLRLSHNVASPAVCGLFQPVILIPKTLLENLPQDKLKAVLTHELAHIKRGDLWVNCLQTLLQIVYFYNPFVWLANMMVRRIREQAVDEMVLVALGTQADSYSSTLIDVAEMAFSRPALSLRLVGVVESKKALSRRIKHILCHPLPKSTKLGISGLLAIIVTAAVLLPMAKADKTNINTDVQIENTTNTEDSISQSGQIEKVIGVIKETKSDIGQITAEHGDAIYGNDIKYTPSLYLGRVRNGTKVQLIESNVIENQYRIPIIKIKTISECPGLPTSTIGWIKLKNTSFKDQFIANENITLNMGEQNKANIILRANVFSANAPISIITNYLRDELGVENTTCDLTDAQATQFRKWMGSLPETTMISNPSMLIFDGETASISIVSNQKEYTTDYEKTSDTSPQYKPVKQKFATGIELEFTPALTKNNSIIHLTMKFDKTDLLKVEEKKHESGNMIELPMLTNSEIVTQVAVPIGKYFLVSAAGLYPAKNDNQPDQPAKQIILLVKADVQDNIEPSGHKVPAGMVGTWFFDNPMGDEEQMAIFQDGRVVVLYSNGHKDHSRYENGFIELAEYDNARFKITILENGSLIQYPDTETGGLAKRWRRIDSQPRTELLRVLTGMDNNQVDVKAIVETQNHAEVIKQLEEMTQSMIQAFNNKNIDKTLSYFSDNAIVLPEQHEIAIGKGSLRNLYLENTKDDTKINSIKSLEQKLWICGEYIFEAGKVKLSFTTPTIRFQLNDWQTYVSVRSRQPDGSLKTLLDSSNSIPIPEDGNVTKPAKPVVIDVASDTKSTKDEIETIYGHIRQYESSFHKAFIDRDIEAASGFYADDAILMPWRQNSLKGKKEIIEYIGKDMAKSPLVTMTQNILHIEGNSRMLYTVSFFTWTFKDPSSGQNVTFPGKGVHVWSRQEDGSWKILLDLHNVSVPVSGN